MIKDAYPYAEIKKDELFVFQSEGQQGFIIKVVQFDFEGSDTWNLGFGDLNEGDIDDKIVSNNHDAMRVIRTVAKITLDFFEKYPKSIIKIEPVDEKRKKLYNIVFQRHFNEIEPNFDVRGSIGNAKEPYSRNKYYDRFELQLK